MAKVYTYPHYKINVIDNSIYNAVATTQLSLFLPIFFMRTQKGNVGVPTYCESYSDAITKCGEGTFDLTSKYFSREAFFLSNVILRRVGAYIVRLADADAKTSSVVLEVKVKKTKVKQWERDAEGYYKYDDETDERIPLIDDETDEQVEEDGVQLTWQVRSLNTGDPRNETYDNLRPTTYGSGDSEYVVYPIMAATCKYVGEYGNDTGFKFFFDSDSVDETLARNVKSLPYSFGIVNKPYGSDTASAVRSKYSSQYESFVVRPNQIDTRTNRQVSFTQVLKNNYNDSDIPWDIKLYSDNIEAIGKVIQEIEVEDETLTDPYLVNITSEYNIEGKPMPHVEITEDSANLNSNYIVYLRDGADGDLTDATIEELTRNYLKNLEFPDILNSARYPFNFIIDTGVSLQTKEAFIDFMGAGREDFKLLLSTQDSNLGRYNTKAEDYSTGMSLYASALLQPESIEKGTECCRVSIFQHAGKVADTAYDAIIPFTYDIAQKKATYLASQVISGQPTGLPNSAVTAFKEWNWDACDADLKQQSWECGLNYVQAYDMTGIHWPVLRTVYRYETSVLSSDFFTDAVVFIKNIVRYQWAKYVGVEMSFSRYASVVSKSVQDAITAMLGGNMVASVTMTQTAEQQALGYESTLTINLTGNAQQRIWSVDFICNREGYDGSSTTTTGE